MCCRSRRWRTCWPRWTPRPRSIPRLPYRSDWARFTLWAGAGGFPSLPAPPLVVAHYITEAAAEMTGVGKWRYTPATLTRWVSSINQFHTAAGYDAPGRSEVVRRALSGIRRIRATPPVRRAPLLLGDIRALMTSLSSVVGVGDDGGTGCGVPGAGVPAGSGLIVAAGLGEVFGLTREW